MKNKIKTGIMIIVVLLVAGVMVWFAHKIIVDSDNSSEIVSNEKNETNKVFEASENIENVDNINQESEVTTEENSAYGNHIEEEENSNQATSDNTVQKNNNTRISNEDRAISIVKKNWGSEEGVYFTTMGIDSNGRYIVTVNDSSTTAVYASYAVNIETGEFEVQ